MILLKKVQLPIGNVCPAASRRQLLPGTFRSATFARQLPIGIKELLSPPELT
jgi:hypothetical protein